MKADNSENNEQNFNWSEKSILIAEDEIINFKFVEKTLEATKIKIFHAINGEDAVRIFSENSTIDIILMDVRMPVMDGMEATKLIRNINRNIPIIAFTAFALTNDEMNALNYGCSDYISKPLQPQFLIQKINEFLK